ncbi:hypothetical protein [Marinovum sp.]|uniref:hypothetical protein n=1 Tax=Marinovum sp. TaxID=2024839 RepID=UPI002B272A07|nr:hypothetical protein [Marinovum sp.]
MQVHGRDIETECYRVTHVVDGREVTALVPERLAADLRPGGRPSHQEAYVWMAGHKDKIETAITRLARGQSAKPPFDTITLLPSSCP